MLLPAGKFTYSCDEYLFDVCPNPACGKFEHFSWNVLKKVGHCFVCDCIITGEYNMMKATKGLGEYLYLPPLGKDYQHLRERGEFHYSNAWDDEKAREFLKARGIDESLARAVPFAFSPEDRVTSVQVEGISPEFPPYSVYRFTDNEDSFWILPKKSQSAYYGFNVQRFSQSKKGLVLMEGIFDVLSSGLYHYGVALCGSTLGDKVINAWCTWLELHASKVAIWFDPDKAGAKGSKEIKKQLDIWGIPNKIITSEKNPKDYRWSNEEDKQVLGDVLRYIHE